LPRLGGHTQETWALERHRRKQSASSDGIIDVDDGENCAEI